MDNNLQPKNEYFAKKEDKERAMAGEGRRKMLRRIQQWLIVLAILGLLGWVVYGYFSKEAAKGPIQSEYFPFQSRDHIQVGANHPAYNSNPPTGGWHYEQPAQSGIYDIVIPDERLVHNLEHSHIWIAYKPDLSADQIEKLADIAKSYGSKIIMTSRPTNDTPIAIVAWEHLIKMDTVDEARIKEFIDAFRGVAGPEKLADFGFKDFRGDKVKEAELGGQMK